MTTRTSSTRSGAILAPRTRSAPWLSRSHRPGLAAGFTLIETLITLGIIAVLLSFMLPAIVGALGMSRGFRCQMSLRSVAMDFAVYADEELHGWRGRDSGMRNRFRLETFIDSQYGTAEFWRWGQTHGPADWPRLSDENGLDPMRCAAVEGDLVLRPETFCVSGAIQTPRTISYSFNARLHRSGFTGPPGRFGLWPVYLTSDILAEGAVPLAWDVNGEASAKRDVTAITSAPPVNDDRRDPYSTGAYWWPSERHAGNMNVVFIDGHVESTRTPLDHPGWRWDYELRGP